MEDTKITGRSVRLRKMEKKDLADRVRWFNDPDVNKTLFLEENLDEENTLKWFDRIKNDGSRIDFTVENNDGELIGVTGLVNINPKHRTAECYCVIGEKRFWGKGIATEVHSLLFELAFDKLGIEKIWADIKPENAAIIKVIERLGFKSEGLLRKDRLIDGQRVDVLRIGLLRKEFKKQH